MDDMGVDNGTEAPSILLQSKNHGELLDVIDLLRSQGISRYISLPQLIVCGDQSAGKSSVLEAVSGVSFPTKDNLCTRFATELILRRDQEENATVAITPGAERTGNEKAKLSEFKASIASIDEIPSLIEKAKEAMGLTGDAKAFSDDVLRVEISGPQQPHLTLVDLPGLIHSENKQQSARDVQLVSSLVRSYMANTRSIILAVVSAKNDYANQIVTKLARDVDPKGLRTLGIITKPDTLHAGSESEKAFLNLARNEDVSFRLGWHVLKNRDYTSRDCSMEERDEAEKAFFSQGVWTSLPMSSLGIGTLKPRLSTVLRDQIILELPKLIRDLHVGIDDCRSRLAKLGDARTTVSEQRAYLMRISQAFSSLVKAAVDGLYVHEFFGDAMTDAGYSRRLRATIQNLLLEFADRMRHEGHAQEIIEGAAEVPSAGPPQPILRLDYIRHVQELMQRSRGRELPGTFNPLIIGDLFYRQSRPWRALVERYCDSVLRATGLCLESVLSHITDETTKDGLLREIIEPAMVICKERLQEKVAEIMRPHQAGHPITYNHYFTDTIQKARQEHTKKEQTKRLNVFLGLKADVGSTYIDRPTGFWTSGLMAVLTTQNEEDMDRYTCSEAIDCMQAYYRVALKVLVDNFAVLGIEFCLLNGLADIFSPNIVMTLNDQLIQDIATETDDARTERVRLDTKLGILESGLKILNRLNRHQPIGDQNEDEDDDASEDPDMPAEPTADGIMPVRMESEEIAFPRERRSSSMESLTPRAHEATATPQVVEVSPYSSNFNAYREAPAPYYK